MLSKEISQNKPEKEKIDINDDYYKVRMDFEISDLNTNLVASYRNLRIARSYSKKESKGQVLEPFIHSETAKESRLIAIKRQMEEAGLSS